MPEPALPRRSARCAGCPFSQRGPGDESTVFKPADFAAWVDGIDDGTPTWGCHDQAWTDPKLCAGACGIPAGRQEATRRALEARWGPAGLSPDVRDLRWEPPPPAPPARWDSYPVQEPSLDDLAVEIAAWQAETFPAATSESVLEHLRREVVVELAADPRDPSEIADVFFFVVALARAADLDPDGLARAVAEKLAVNRSRTWGEPDEQGVVEHVREAGRPAAADDPTLGVIRELLVNRTCPCGGWTCARCRITVEEAEALVPDLRDNIDRERDEAARELGDEDDGWDWPFALADGVTMPAAGQPNVPPPPPPPARWGDAPDNGGQAQVLEETRLATGSTRWRFVGPSRQTQAEAVADFRAFDDAVAIQVALGERPGPGPGEVPL